MAAMPGGDLAGIFLLEFRQHLHLPSLGQAHEVPVGCSNGNAKPEPAVQDLAMKQVIHYKVLWVNLKKEFKVALLDHKKMIITYQMILMKKII